ncbi:MAG TPA: RHS repeat-associated core domain-containing protein [Thermoanaerobaculia bacterium]|nr:RHS repeat-associated core domain-containing protein [Thermoanaerobaculia bacterium]
MQLIDVNGDRVPDRAWTTPSGLVVALGQSGGWAGSLSTDRAMNLGSEDEWGGQLGVDVACPAGPVSISGGASMSLRKSGANSVLTDADGDGIPDLVGGDRFLRGLPRTCRDGNPPSAAGVCGDGMQACTTPRALCFVDDKLSEHAPKRASIEPREASAILLVKNALQEPSPRRRRAVRPSPQEPIAPVEPKNRFTALRQRLAADPELAKEMYPLDPVIRWDAQHDGAIAMYARARRRHAGSGDGVTVTLLRVKNPRGEDGTERVSTVSLPPPSLAWRTIADNAAFRVSFGESFLLVVDTGNHVSIDGAGTLLDEIEIEWQIVYTEVCPLAAGGEPCVRPDLRHLGPTGHPAYVYRFPEDFRLSELPRDAYWRLLPPLSHQPRRRTRIPEPPFTDPPFTEVSPNRITGVVRKLAPTGTPVHVRIRCESLESVHADDGSVCPLGTILAERVFTADAVDEEQSLTVSLPSPFVPWVETQLPGDMCWTYQTQDLRVEPAPGIPAFQVTDGTEVVALVLTEVQANQALAVARRHTGYCLIRNTPDSVMRFWTGNSRIATNLGTEECLTYRPSDLRIVPEEGRWTLTDGQQRIREFSSEEPALRALEIARHHVGRCTIGPWENRGGLSVEYWKAPRIYQPTRLLFEVDGENGFEIPPEAIRWKPLLDIVSLEDIETKPFSSTQQRLHATGNVDFIDAEQPWLERPPVLFRVHPARQLTAFRAADGAVLDLNLGVTELRKPFIVTVLSDDFTVIDALTVPSGSDSFKRSVTLPRNGLYYVRGYTEAGFAELTRINLSADLTNPGSPPVEAPVNLLTAVFGGGRYLGISEPLPGLIGEVPYSQEPYAGGHHGFFYGQFNGNEEKVCIGPRDCETPCTGPNCPGGFSPFTDSSQDDPDGDGLSQTDRCPFAAEDFDAGEVIDGCPDDPVVPSDCTGDAIDLSPEGRCGRSMRRFAAPQANDETDCYVGSDPIARICKDHTHPTLNISAPHNRKGIVDGDLRRSWSLGLSVFAGVELPIGKFLGADWSAKPSIQGAIGTTWTDLELQDWNGDQVVDSVDPGGATLGGLNRRIATDPQLLMFDAVRDTLTTTIGFGISGGAGAMYLEPGPGGTIKSIGTMHLNFGLHALAGISNTVVDRLDVNGDGLPDVVHGDDDLSGTRMIVQLNLGTRLGEPENWGNIEMTDDPAASLPALLGLGPLARAQSITQTDNLTTGFGIGGSASGTAGGFGGGVSGGRSDDATLAQSSIAFADLNGDGLPDKVSKAPDPCTTAATLRVRFNQGTTWGAEHVLTVPCWTNPPTFPGSRSGLGAPVVFLNEVIERTPDVLELSGSVTRTWQGSVSVTLFGYSASAGYGRSSGRSHVEMRLDDTDGDGLTDRVLRNGGETGGGVQVQRNRLGGANLLQFVHQPLGGQIELKYRLRLPSEDDPEARWIVTTATWRPEPAYPDVYRTAAITHAFDYEDPYYDRFERELYGFRTVRSTRGDGRIEEREYFNRDYRLQGFIKRSAIREGRVVLRETTNEYALQRRHAAQSSCNDALVLPLVRLRDSPQGAPCEVWFARPVAEMTRFHERVSAATKETAQRYLEHDAFGNVLQMVDEGDEGTSDDLCALFTYDTRPELLAANIVDRATSVEVRGATNRDGAWQCDGPRLRFRAGEYDLSGRLIAHRTHADNAGTRVATLRFEYEATGFMTASSDGTGYRAEYVPDEAIHLFAKETRDSFLLSARATHDLRFQVPTEVIDANGEKQTSTYDTFGRLIAVAGPYELAAGIESAKFEYSIPGPAMPAGVVTTNCAAILGADGRSPSPAPGLRCEAPGGANVTVLRIAQYADSLGRELQRQTDAAVGGVRGRIVSGRVELDAAGRVEFQAQPHFRPAAAGAPLTAVAANERELTRFPTRRIYDVLDRPIRTEEPGETGARVTTTVHEIANHPHTAGMKTLRATITDPEDRIREEHMDASARLVAVVQNLGTRPLTTTYRYQPTGELVEVRDSLQRITSLEHDLAGRRTAVTTPDTGRLQMVYDSNGRLMEKTDPVLRAAGRKIVYGYTANRLVSVSYPGGSLPAVRFTYGDGAGALTCRGQSRIRGRVCSIVDASGGELRSYGALGEVIESTRRLPTELATVGPPRTFTTNFVYDSFGRMLSLSWPDAERLRYTYDGGGRVKSATATKGSASIPYVSAIHYDEFGSRTEVRAGNGVITRFRYEPSTRWLDVETITAPGGEELRSLDHAYDQMGNVERVMETRPGGSAATPFLGPVERTYSYDDLDRLTTFSFRAAEARAGAPAWSVSATYGYDDVGNLTGQTVTRTRGSLLLRDYPTRNWTYTYKSSTRPNLPETIGPYSYTYDTRGSMLRSSRKAGDPRLPHSATYAWDDENRLRTSRREGSALPTETTYTYDASGERVRKETLLSGICGRTRCADATVYVNPYYTARFARRAAEGPCRTGTCWEQVISRTKHVYVDGQRLAVIAEVVAADHTNERSIAFVSPAVRQFFHIDRVGSTALVTDRSGKRSEEIDYLPFGEELFDRVAGDRPTLPQHFGFNGKELDSETGLQYFGARYYDPRIGRWLSADPLYRVQPETNLDEPGLLNLYAFCLNQPTTLSDPNGLSSLEVDGPRAREFVDLLARLSGLRLHRPGGSKVEVDPNGLVDPFVSPTLQRLVREVIDGPDRVRVTAFESFPNGFVDSFEAAPHLPAGSVLMRDFATLDRVAPELTSGLLGHVLEEYRTAAILGTPRGGSASDAQFNRAHVPALQTEARIVSDLTGRRIWGAPGDRTKRAWERRVGNINMRSYGPDLKYQMIFNIAPIRLRTVIRPRGLR